MKDLLEQRLEILSRLGHLPDRSAVDYLFGAIYETQGPDSTLLLLKKLLIE